jgi:tetratricopeptide (TPR) repeat protein
MNLRRLSFPLALALAFPTAWLATAPAARADELRVLDPATCAPTTKVVAEIVDESWTQISYRVKAGQPVEKVDTRLVLDIRRTNEDSQAQAFRSALMELQNGAFESARAQFASVGGGGRTADAGTGKLEFRPFPPEAGKAKWYAGYAVYHYALASYRQGVAKGDKQLVEDALRALDANAGEEKGFLERYKEGKSRWYADALLLKADALLELGQYDKAAAAYDALYQKSITTPIGVRFAYAAKMGPGRIAEAKGDANAAQSAYDAGTAALQSLLEQPADACTRRDLGRFYSEARMQKARVMLGAAEKGGPAVYAQLRAYLAQGTPEALRQRMAGKPAEVVDAVVGGALAPTVQALAQNGVGLAFLAEKKYADAVNAFTQVRIKYFAVTDEVPRALYHLAKAAAAAAAAATKPAAKSLYQAQAESARQELQRGWKSSPWASK